MEMSNRCVLCDTPSRHYITCFLGGSDSSTLQTAVEGVALNPHVPIAQYPAGIIVYRTQQLEWWRGGLSSEKNKEQRAYCNRRSKVSNLGLQAIVSTTNPRLLFWRVSQDRKLVEGYHALFGLLLQFHIYIYYWKMVLVIRI